MAEANPPRSKMRFRRNAISFPGNLHLILVLRPTNFLQRTFTDIGFRFSHEDFMLKLPVVMLSSVSDLLTFIDDKQLTPEFGGTLHYCHREWIVYRNAIENFALTVKETAQMLQSFGTELAEKDLPNDIPGIEHIIAVRAQKYRLLKDNITAVIKEGNFLLRSLEGPPTGAAAAACSSLELHQPRNGDGQTVKKLLTQVHDMEVAFDGFWDKHQIKMKQYLQLWKFEQDFQELVTEVQFLLSQYIEMAEETETFSQVKQKMQKLDNLDEVSQNVLSKAHFVILHGHRLAANHHYALDLICQRCNELRYLSDILAKEIKAKRIQLSRTFKMHSLIQQARQCCDEGECLLAKQDMDKLQSKEDAEKTVQSIKNFLETALPFLSYNIENFSCEFDVILSPELKLQMQSLQVKLENIRSIFEDQQAGVKNLAEKQLTIQSMVPDPSSSLIKSRIPFFTSNHGKKTWSQSQSNIKIEVVHDFQDKRHSDPPPSVNSDNNLKILKQHVLHELIQTEKVYVHELFSVLLGYRSEMDNPEMFGLMPPALRNKKDVLFGNMAEIYEFHNNIFMSSLESCANAPERVGPCFLERKDDFKMYAKYCQNKPKSEAVWKKFSECAFFQECQKKLKHRLRLDSYLLKPVQRITKYQLLLKELLKYSKDCLGTNELKEALDTMLDLLKSVNDSMHQIAINGYKGNINDLGKMIAQNAFSVWAGHRKGATKMKEFARFKPMQRHLFLYEKAIVFCKKRVDGGDGACRLPSYSFKNSLNLDEIGITEYVKGDTRKFEIWCGGKEEIYIVQAPNIDVKLTWLKELRSVLLKHQEVLTVKNPLSCLLTEQEQLFFQEKDENQLGAMGGSEEIKSVHSSTLAEVGEAIASLKAQASKVLTAISLRPQIPEGAEESPSHCVYPSDDGNNEDKSPLMPL
ncbi:proto-oncogene DBL [Suncus etruscus]|uniref:proto-oncogene DBL n=1 Tax=Suncus etruscus TaxID=109475 RepID=UPI00211093C7|nr:proto-oncogene DBL [Suncus etruscus]